MIRDGAEVFVPSSECRICSNKRTTRGRRDRTKRRKDAALNPTAAAIAEGGYLGPCDVCGRRTPRNLILVPRPALACVACSNVLKGTAADSRTITEGWRFFVQHIAQERALDQEWNSTRRRHPHQGNHHLEDIPPDHNDCILFEETYRSVLTFVLRPERPVKSLARLITLA
jgi:hypothetical protein